MDRTSLTRIERMNYILGGAFVALVAVLGTGEHLLGAVVGASLSALNFTLLRGLVEKMAAAASGKSTSRLAGLALIPKLLALMAAVAPRSSSCRCRSRWWRLDFLSFWSRSPSRPCGMCCATRQ